MWRDTLVLIATINSTFLRICIIKFLAFSEENNSWDFKKKSWDYYEKVSRIITMNILSFSLKIKNNMKCVEKSLRFIYIISYGLLSKEISKELGTN